MAAISLIQQLTWADAREDVKKADQALARIIDKISPNKNYSLFKVTYSFGDLVVKEGMLHLPQEENRLISLADASLDNKIQAKLGYSPIPLFLTLQNCHEVFLDTGDRAIPLNLFNTGSLLGLFESIDFLFGRRSAPRWNVSAGARSLFMLPKVSETQGFKRLSKCYKLDALDSQLTHFSDHWHVFKSIAAHSAFTQSWKSEILVFSKEWLNNDLGWAEFRRYLFQHAWQQSQFATNKVELSLVWEMFLKTVALRRLKPTTYLADHIKHLMLIASGHSPGFRPADDSQQAAPLRGLQEAFLNIYMLKHYLPTFMHPQLLNTASSTLPVYYSLLFPTLLEGSPYKKNSSTIMLDLHGIHSLLTILLDKLSQNTFFVGSGLQGVYFNYFHVEPDQQGKIRSSQLIPEKDTDFLREQIDFPDRVFCASSAFWRGCIKIARQQ